MATNLTGAEVQSLAHWYLISAVVTLASTDTTFIIYGDTITGDRRNDTNRIYLWPDYLFARGQLPSSTHNIAIVYQAADGNRMLYDSLDSSNLSRVDRDVLAQSGVTFALMFKVVNDIGAASPHQMSRRGVYHDLIAAYRQFITRVDATDVPRFCATFTPINNLNTSLQLYSDSTLECPRQAPKE